MQQHLQINLFFRMKSWSGMLVTCRGLRSPRKLQGLSQQQTSETPPPPQKKKTDPSPQPSPAVHRRKQISVFYQDPFPFQSDAAPEFVCFCSAGFTPGFWGSSPAGRSALASCHIYYLVCHSLYTEAQTKCTKISGEHSFCFSFHSQLMNFEKNFNSKVNFTFSKLLFTKPPFAPTKTQLSRYPSFWIDELPSSAIKFRASSFNLLKNIRHQRVDKHHLTFQTQELLDPQ